jgi:hypothetical protein
MSSGDISLHNDNSIPIPNDINEASCVSPELILVTNPSTVCAVDLGAPTAEHKDVLCESSECCDETLTSNGDAEVCVSPTTIRHPSPADKAVLHEAATSHCKGPNSATSSLEEPGGDTASDLKIPALSICVS